VSLPWWATTVLWARRVRKSNFQKSGVGEGSECENLRDQNPEKNPPEAPKSRNPKFHLESLVAPSSLAFDHGPWTHGLGTKKTGAITRNCRAKQSSENSWNRNVFLFALVYECCSFIKGLRPDKLRLTARCVCRVQRVSGQPRIDAEYRNGRGVDCLQFRERKRRKGCQLGSRRIELQWARKRIG
jgi:hypothetical protein